MLNVLETPPLTRHEPLMGRLAPGLLVGLYLHLALVASWLMMASVALLGSSSWVVALVVTAAFFFVFTGPLALWAVVHRHGWVWMLPVLVLAFAAGVMIDSTLLGAVFACWVSGLAAPLAVLLPVLVRCALRLTPRRRP